MDGQSLTPQQVKIQQIKQVLPEVFSEGKIDWEKLKATLGEDVIFSNERYVLNWAGKSDAFRVLRHQVQKPWPRQRRNPSTLRKPEISLSKAKTLKC